MLAAGAGVVGFLLGCSSDEAVARGEYSTERTVIVTGIGAPDADGCGQPQAPVSGDAAYRYRVAEDGERLRVTELVGGCVLDARSENGIVVADGAECELGPNAALRELGVTNRIYTVFRLDPKAKLVRTRALTRSVVTSGEARSCTVTEERIVGFR